MDRRTWVSEPNYCICCMKETQWQTRTRLPSVLFGCAAEIQRCSECGLGRTLPPPETSGDYYDDNPHYDVQFSSQRDLYRRFARELLSTLDGMVEPAGKRLLDVGCGGGFLVEAASAAGFLAEGIDANRNMVNWCIQRGLNVRQGDVTMLKRTGRRYDVIVLSAILEHVYEPEKLLGDCKSLLTGDGVLLIAQASCDGLLPLAFPWGWYGWQPKEHFWHFTPDSLRKLAGQSGFLCARTVRTTLYHPWFMSGGIKVIVGRNIAALLARLGQALGKGDAFNMILRPNPDGES